MSSYSLVHVSDEFLSHDLGAYATRRNAVDAGFLARLAEFDARKLYLPAAYPSMYAYCLGKLHLSEDAASKRIQAARVARRCPGVFDAVAEGRLHLSGVVLLAPHLTPESEAELLAAATHKSKVEIERLLAERYPRLPEPARLEAIPGSPQHAPGHVEGLPGAASDEHAPGHVEKRRPQVTPLAPESFALHCTLDREAHEHLRQAQALLGHQVVSGDIGVVVARALKLLVTHLEKRKFGAAAKPRPRSGRPSTRRRHIPAEVKRTVWRRDGGQCTFVGENGHRCASRTRLEFDHVEPVARGGTATVGGIRLRCRAHNQYEAERAFGADFMCQKRDEARKRAEAGGAATIAAAGPAPAEEDDKDVIPWLRALGYRADQARYAAERCAGMPDDASLEQRVRVALSMLARPRR
jgi:hypothetical protein